MARKQGSLTKTPNKLVKNFLAGYFKVADTPKWLASLCGGNEMYFQALRVIDVITINSVEEFLRRWRHANLKEVYSPSMVELHTREIRKLSVQLVEELKHRKQDAYALSGEAQEGTTGILLTKAQKRRVELMAENFDNDGIRSFTRRVIAQLKGNQL